MILHTLQHACTMRTLQRLHPEVLSADLGQIQCVSDLANDVGRKRKKVLLGRAGPTERFHIIWRTIAKLT